MKKFIIMLSLAVAVGITAVPALSLAEGDQAPACSATTQTIVSDAVTQVEGNGAATVLSPHGAWTTSLSSSGAEWIWSSDGSEDTTTATTSATFIRSFTIVGPVSSGTLELAADNGYQVWVNGTPIADQSTVKDNYTSTHTYDITSSLHAGANTLTVEVTNFPLAGSTFTNNPAGLVYKLSYVDDECPPVVEPPINACATPTEPPTGYTLVSGTPGNDHVRLADHEMFVGYGGNDMVTAGAGDHIICLGDGNHSVRVGNGNNVITATGGNNVVRTGNGIQYVTTGAGNDNIRTGNGNDVINAGNGNNVVSARGGDDSITTGSGNDRIDGGAGTDTCDAGAGHNSVVRCETVL